MRSDVICGSPKPCKWSRQEGAAFDALNAAIAKVSRDRKAFDMNLAKIAAVAVVCVGITGCTTQTAFDRSYSSYQSEMDRIDQPPLAREDFAGKQVRDEEIRIKRVQEREAQRARFEGERLKQAGFQPATSLVGTKIEIRRVSFMESRLYFATPGIAFTRMADGRVSLNIEPGNRTRGFSTVLSEQSWSQITRGERAALAPRNPDHNGGTRNPNIICHADFATIERISGSEVTRRDAHGCVGASDKAALDYADRLLRLALASDPICRAMTGDGSPLWIFAECYGALPGRVTKR